MRTKASLVRGARESAGARLLATGAVVLALHGCKSSTLGPDLTGSIEGQVVVFETAEPIAGAGITTTPATEAIVTDDEGRFRIDDLTVGEYQVTARRSGYSASSVAVSVREDRTSTAVLFLESEETAAEPSLDVEILAWWNTTGGADSTFVEAEYRVTNPGTEPVTAYEIYFRITTDQNDFFHEEQGDNLVTDQSNIRRFKTYIVDRTATGVLVEGVWADG